MCIRDSFITGGRWPLQISRRSTGTPKCCMAWSSTRSGSASWHRVNYTWLVKNMALSAVAVFLRLSWRTVSGIVTRVVAELTGKTDQLDGLRRIGIDKIAYRKGTGI